MAAAGKALSWDTPPKNGHEVYFSHDLYEKYSLAPALSELLLLSRRKAEDNADRSKPGRENRISGGQESVQAGVKSSSDSAAFQEPRVPYPYVSSLTEGEQRRYLFLLSTYLNAEPSRIDLSKQNDYSQYLQMKEFVSKEVAEFLKFAQNAARTCAEDYNSISEEALLYSKRFLNSCIGSVKKYPERYTLHEVTSIMGGKFSTELTLKLEASLVVLGKVNLLKLHFPKMPAQIQLPANIKNESAVTTPEQRASRLHHDVSADLNAEKLASKYCPQVVLTSESLFTLLNNHGLNYKEQWELPVSVKNISVAGSEPVRVVYIDPPLPKKEMTVREKNQFFHEFLADFHTTKQSSVSACTPILDRPHRDPENLDPPETCPGRQMRVLEPTDLDFDTDVTELETFGSSSKALNVSKPQSTPAKPANAPKIGLEELLRMEKQLLSEVSGGAARRSSKVNDHPASAHGGRQSLNRAPSTGSALGLVCKGGSSVQGVELTAAGPSSEGAPAVQEHKSDNNPRVPPCESDTKEDSLNIDAECENNAKLIVVPSSQSPVADGPKLPCSTKDLPEKTVNSLEVPDQEMDTPEKPKLLKVGEILKMQTELLKDPPSSSPEQAEVCTENSSNPTSSQTPLVSEVSVVSTLEPGQSTTAGTSTLPKLTWLSHFQGSQKGSLRDAFEDLAEYEAPPQGNLVYKLFHLDDLLLLVRCSVQKAELRPRNRKIKRHYPVYVLPKLEYQAFYGAEALTEGEVCRLWTESLLHSSCSFVVAHIDALTSKLFLVEKLSAEGLRRRFGTFKPANSLNILQHILKKVTGLQEGSYLLAHAAGDSSVTIRKSCLEKDARGTYNLYAAHSDLPGPPATLSVPWVPLDPNVVLPYPGTQGRVPCTFPPRPADAKKDHKMSGTSARPDTPNRRKQVSKETNSDCSPTQPFRKRARPAQNEAMMSHDYRQAKRGPHWKFWKHTKRNQDDPA